MELGHSRVRLDPLDVSPAQINFQIKPCLCIPHVITPYVKSWTRLTAVAAAETPLRHLSAIHHQLDLSAFSTGRRVLGFAGRIFLSRISSASRGTAPLEGQQPFDMTIDLKPSLVAGSLDCNYNLATT
jgi:hypothetical protein